MAKLTKPQKRALVALAVWQSSYSAGDAAHVEAAKRRQKELGQLWESLGGSSFHQHVFIYRPEYASRWDLGRIARKDCNSFPLATMVTLHSQGLAEPEILEAVTLVQSGDCRCGCDRWKITTDGFVLVSSWDVRFPNAVEESP